MMFSRFFWWLDLNFFYSKTCKQMPYEDAQKQMPQEDAQKQLIDDCFIKVGDI